MANPFDQHASSAAACRSSWASSMPDRSNATGLPGAGQQFYENEFVEWIRAVQLMGRTVADAAGWALLPAAAAITSATAVRSSSSHSSLS